MRKTDETGRGQGGWPCGLCEVDNTPADDRLGGRGISLDRPRKRSRLQHSKFLNKRLSPNRTIPTMCPWMYLSFEARMVNNGWISTVLLTSPCRFSARIHALRSCCRASLRSRAATTFIRCHDRLQRPSMSFPVHLSIVSAPVYKSARTLCCRVRSRLLGFLSFLAFSS